MAKGKSSKQQRKGGGAAAGRAKTGAKRIASVQNNPFERRAITKKKHDIFNRRVKGANRNVAQARSMAEQRRAETLLQDYKQNKKANSFDDRRFGETDATLGLEDKMWGRMQQESLRRSRSRASAYNLEEDAGGAGGHSDSDDGGGGLGALTHKGRPLGARAADYEDGAGSDDDDAFGLSSEVVDRLHFGGGGGGVGGGGGGAAAGRDRGVSSGWEEKSRKEVLDEIIAKSKKGRAEKAKGKEEQDAGVETLDGGFHELMGLLDMRQFDGGGEEKGRGQDGSKRGKKRELDDYDKMMREFVYEARGKATDRTKTAEEEAKAARDKLDKLEDKRRRRMNGEESDDSEEEEGQGGGGGRRKGAGSGEGGGKKEKRREGPRNDDELDDKYSPAEVAGGGRLDAQGILWAGEEDEEKESGGDEDDEDEDEEEEEEEEEEDEEEEDDSGESDEEEEDEQKQRQQQKKKTTKKNGVETAIPYVLECPQSMDELQDLLDEFAHTAEDINTVVDRIVKCHSVKLDTKNKEKMHNFYDVLLKRLVRVGDQALLLPKGGPLDGVSQLDCLASVLYRVTQEMPEAASSLWHRTMGGMQRRLAKSLRDHFEGIAPSSARSRSTWPSPGHLLLLRQMGHLFPTTDYRHSVVTPALLYLGQCLSQCPVQSCADLSTGVFCCGLLLQFTLPAGRLCPEVFAFLTSALALFLPPPAPKAVDGNRGKKGKAKAKAKANGKGKAKAADGKGEKGEEEEEGRQRMAMAREEREACMITPALRSAPLDFLRGSASQWDGNGEEGGDSAGADSGSGSGASSVGALDLRQALAADAEGEAGEGGARASFACCTLAAIYRLLYASLAGLKRRCVAVPEVFALPLAVLEKVLPQQEPPLPQALQVMHVKLAEALTSTMSTMLGLGSGEETTTPPVTATAAADEAAGATQVGDTLRLPLAWQAKGVSSIKGLAPKFQEKYTMRKDGDLDRDAAKIKQMQRQVKREKKGAARELKKDSTFLEQQRWKDKREEEETRKQKWRENLTWLEGEQSTWNQQVGNKKARHLIKGGGSAQVKKPTVGRGH